MRVRTYTNVWRAERLIYTIGDFRLPRPVKMSQVIVFMGIFFLSFLMKGFPPFIFQGAIMDHIAIPAFTAYVLGRRAFDGKRPLSFLRSCAFYFFKHRAHVMGREYRPQEVAYRSQHIMIGRQLCEESGLLFLSREEGERNGREGKREEEAVPGEVSGEQSGIRP